MRVFLPSGLKKFLGLTAGALLFAALAVGCSSDDDGDAASGDGTPPVITASATTESGDSGESPEATATTESGDNGDSGDSSDSNGSDITVADLSSLSSYKYKLTMSGSGGPLNEFEQSLGTGGGGEIALEVDGAYISPDRARTTIALGDLEIVQTVIGDQQWTEVAGIVSGPSPATTTDLNDAVFISNFWDGSDFESAIDQFECGEPESINGVQAVKCGIDAETYAALREQLGGFFGADSEIQDLTTFNFEVWVTEDGIPVSMRVTMIGADASGEDFELVLTMDVTDINASFEIEAPE